MTVSFATIKGRRNGVTFELIQHTHSDISLSASWAGLFDNYPRGETGDIIAEMQHEAC